MMKITGERRPGSRQNNVTVLRPLASQRLRRRARMPVPARRPPFRQLPPDTTGTVRPLLRVVVSNPHPLRVRHDRVPPHLFLVPMAPVEQRALEAPRDLWDTRDTRNHLWIVCGLAAAGLVALATSIGNLLMIKP